MFSLVARALSLAERGRDWFSTEPYAAPVIEARSYLSFVLNEDWSARVVAIAVALLSCALMLLVYYVFVRPATIALRWIGWIALVLGPPLILGYLVANV